MSYSTRCMTPADWPQSTYFTASEFKVPEKMGYEFMLWLNKVRALAGVPMTITSSYRTPAYNASVGGAQDSAHTDTICEAVDIGTRPTAGDLHWNTARFYIIDAALKLGCRRIGIYPNGSLHLDRTESHRPAPRLWIAVDHPAH